MRGRPPTSRWSYERNLQELRLALDRQTANLRRSSKAFDEGASEEAERLAASIYIICHDSGQQSQSLLGQLGLKQQMKFPHSPSADQLEPGTARIGPPLCHLHWDEVGHVSLVPRFGDTNEMSWLAFSRWWDHEIYTSEKRLKLSRKNLVFTLRGQDGGAHVDGSLRDEAYYRFSTRSDHVARNETGTLTVNTITNSDGSPLQNAHWISMRQIAWELDQALKRVPV